MLEPINIEAEWLEADGLGGFASGTVSGVRTRRYHGLLLTATRPPTGRMLLVNGFDAWAELGGERFAISSQMYEPGLIPADQRVEIESFTLEPWPTWVFRLPNGLRIQQEILAAHGRSKVLVLWKQLESAQPVVLCARPLLSGRDYHALHHENGAFQFEPVQTETSQVWHPYAGVPGICSAANGAYQHDPHWYRNFHYPQEQQRGLEHTEDLAAPGILRFNLSDREAVWILATESTATAKGADDPVAQAKALREAERRRRARFPTPLHRAADAYLVKRGSGQTVIAGYPWFTDWGRDTFIALRGLCLATGRYNDARAILLEWAGVVSEGMLPNRFPDQGATPEFNSVDASLWYVIVVYELFAAAQLGRTRVTLDERRRLEDAVRAILSGYEQGTRFGIRCDSDGLLAAGEPGVQLTWMDAKVGDWVVTPRSGKPVEVQALWLNALWTARHLSDHWDELFLRGRDSFRERFWSDVRGHLYDVVDAEHHPGRVEAQLRPNQIFAIGGLPIPLLENGRARRLVDVVERQLLTPLGLRSLAPDDPDYAAHYRGGVLERDGAYHQGTVWPWLMGAFVEAWLRVRGNTAAARDEARRRFLPPLEKHLSQAGLGHVSEVADGDAPHTPGGCPFQAWSLGELLRIKYHILNEEVLGNQSGRAPVAVVDSAKTLRQPA